MKILNECSFLGPKQIAIIEEKYNAKYVFESCIKNSNGGWVNFPVAIFYTEEAHPEGSNYFAFYERDGRFYISNGISATEPFFGVLVEDEVIYSRYRHDFRERNGIFVDGGRDYIRSSSNKTVELKVEKNQLVVAS